MDFNNKIASFITGENICIDGGMTRQMIYHTVDHFPAVAHSHRFSSFTVMLRSRKPTFVRWRLISSGV